MNKKIMVCIKKASGMSQDSLEPQNLWNEYGIYWKDLQAAVQITEQWPAMSRKSKNLVIAQSHQSRYFQLVFCISCNLEEVGSEGW